MTTQTLTATQLAVDGTGTNLTALMAEPTGLTLVFQNTLNTILLIQPSTTAQTVQVDISSLVEGETVSPFSSATLTSSDVYAFGPFHSVLDEPGTNYVQVSLGSDTLADILVGLITIPGVY